MAHIVQQYNEMGQFLTMLAFAGFDKYGRTNASMTEADETHGWHTLPAFLACVQQGTLTDLAHRVSRIQAIATEMHGQIPGGASIKRQHTWSRSGHTVSVHKVLGGHLGKAWKKSVAQHVSSRDLTIVIPSAVPNIVSTEERFYQAAGTCALAAHAAQCGFRVNVWGMHMHAGPFENTNKSVIILVQMLSSAEPWSLSRVALMTYTEWSRRLMFRVVEILQPVYGPVYTNYGPPGRAADMLAWLQSAWAPSRRLAPDSIVLGCTYQDYVSDEASALAWVQRKLQDLSHAA